MPLEATFSASGVVEDHPGGLQNGARDYAPAAIFFQSGYCFGELPVWGGGGWEGSPGRTGGLPLAPLPTLGPPLPTARPWSTCSASLQAEDQGQDCRGASQQAVLSLGPSWTPPPVWAVPGFVTAAGSVIGH